MRFPVAGSNAWHVYDDLLVAWCARLPADRSVLRRWRTRCLGLGEGLSVYDVDAVPWMDFRRDRDGRLLDVLDRAAGADPGLGVFGLTTRSTALLAHLDVAGTVVEREVSDVAELLDAADREDAGSAAPLSLFPLTGAADATVLALVRSDIWLPWCREGEVAGSLVDNRALAGRHTPRLNAFLAGLADVTRELGGTWALDEVPGDLAFQIDEHGVALDARPTR